MTNPVTLAISLLGLSQVARACDVSYQAVRKWERQGRFPRTEWTGETDYIPRVVKAATDAGKDLTRESLLVVCPTGNPGSQPNQQAAA